ncbi:structure-specific endonuclease subunit SLX4 [Kryptolebias marmoratus]|uniref:Structure-specific endonuclease subunit SLX4 n=1 Tax=Kryptolebias marmoratus TaxID=37003 RepID=A0A3Q3GTQ4_KRYMA|nr:structure-specific endonuclease subunit SLX4 [Kryptolebias marmoratus]
MDDSDQDFVDICSKLLKRVRKKKGEQQVLSQATQGDKRMRSNPQGGDSGWRLAATQPVGAEAEQDVVCGGARFDPGESSDRVAQTDRGLRAKDKVLLKIQHFRRASPQKMAHNDNIQPTKQDACALTAQRQIQDPPVSLGSARHTESDEALALRLQQQLDREAAGAQTVDLEDGGLFFCQICHRDLSHMAPEGRTQHLNRCLDKSEESDPAALPAAPPASAVPDCPICGKKFKSQKSRSTHLKRCSADMGVPPAMLLQALQRQAQESPSAATANTLLQSGVKKRKGPPRPGVPARKKPRTKAEPLDEETMVALALSCSMAEKEKERQKEKEAEKHLQNECVPSHSSMNPALRWRPDAAKGHGRKKKGAVPRPPPLLLVQDAETALARLQDRVSALLLCRRAPSPPTPTLRPSSLPSWTGAVLLWQKSALLDGDSTCSSDFYAAELKPFFTSLEPVKADAAPSTTGNEPESVRPVSEETPVSGPSASVRPSCSQMASCSSGPSTPGAAQLPVGSQTLRDLMELAEDGMTLTQYGYAAKEIHLSGFIQDDEAEPISGFLPETTHKPSDDPHRPGERTTVQPGADTERNSHGSVALSRLVSDLTSMVNNPQLSDVQLQVDSGEVYFAHSFMMYARCPLLAEMVHESGIGVKEEGTPAAQRVLLSDVPGQAVFALLQYLYTARCSVPAPLLPHMLELASRFDLQNLEQLCHLQQETAEDVGGEVLDVNQEEHANNQTDQAFMELLRSMWNGEDEDATDSDSGGGGGGGGGGGMEEAHRPDEVASGDRELREEQVNQEELEEIYEFAATQRKKKERDSEEEEEDKKMDEEQSGEEVFTKLTEPKEGLGDKKLHPKIPSESDAGLDCSYSRLFSQPWGVYEEGDHSLISNTPKTHPLPSKQHRSPHKASSVLQSSESLVVDLAVSPPLVTPSLPVPGESPGQGSDQEDGGAKRKEATGPDVPTTRESRVTRSICTPPPDSPPKKEEPELIVLSDSSEDMEVGPAVLSPCRLSAPSSSPQNLQSYTDIKSRQDPTPSEKKESGGSTGHESKLLDCSPEISWLIPSTPLQSDRSTRSSSTQTKSSICRTQLFPKEDSSPPSASVFSSPALTLSNKRRNSHEPSRATESNVPGLKPNRSPLRSLDREASLKKSCDVSKNGDVFLVKSSPPKLPRFSSSTHYSLQTFSKPDTPQRHQQPYSSTPLHTELHQPPIPPPASPLQADADKRKSPSRRGESVSSGSMEKSGLGSLHLSPSESPSSSSYSGCQSNRQRTSSSQSRRSAESSSNDRMGARNEREENQMGRSNEEANGGTGEADAGEPSFQQSFVDEPPIAFNDSWGLDAYAETNPGCFSLRLEDSGGSNLQENSSRRQVTTRSSSASTSNPTPGDRVEGNANRGGAPASPPPQQPSPPEPNARPTPEIDSGLLDSKLWDSWEEDEGEENLPLSQRVTALPKTPALQSKKRRSVVPITPTPHYSDMDTPELRTKLSRFGVRPLPKRQMVLKLKEIHQYTHQLVSSDSEDEAPQAKPPPRRLVSRAQTAEFKEPRAPAVVSPVKNDQGEEANSLSASQGSNTSSTATSDESERSNPEQVLSSDGDSDSDGGVSSSQAASRLQDRLQAVRSFILSDSRLYSQILQYQPVVLSQFQAQLKAAGICLGAARLVDYLDSQCITFTTAKPGHSAPGRGRRGRKAGKGATGKKNAAAKL